MDYKEKYEQALKRAKQVHEYSSDLAEIKRMKDIFPELAESKDERIRKTLIEMFSNVGKKEWRNIPTEKIIAWLEKQGEQKSYDELPQTPHKYEVGNWIVSRYGSTYQVKEVLKGSYNLLCESGAEEINSISQVDNSSRLLTMHDIIKKQKPVEWSEEDDEYLQDTINYFNVDDALQHSEKDVIRWLKSLKERYTWKPSDEQIKALKETCDEHWEPDGLDPLYSLLEQLKKLKENKL